MHLDVMCAHVCIGGEGDLVSVQMRLDQTERGSAHKLLIKLNKKNPIEHEYQ